eukprot:13911359-Heterocapsa_arctica.AAC.1
MAGQREGAPMVTHCCTGSGKLGTRQETAKKQASCGCPRELALRPSMQAERAGKKAEDLCRRYLSAGEPQTSREREIPGSEQRPRTLRGRGRAA